MREYTVDIAGTEHTLQLSDEDAKRLGAKPVKDGAADQKQASAPKNKARSAANKKG